MDKIELTRRIKYKAHELGFLDIGIARAEFMSEEAKNLEVWLSQHYQGEMSYLERNFDKRVNPTELVPGAKTVISLAYNYFNPEKQKDEKAPKISMYAYGRDYHKVVRKKISDLFEFIRLSTGNVQGRVFVDSAPVLERDWAKRSGLGWIGKNTMLISPKKGSWFFLGELIIDIDLIYDSPIKDHCGTCTRCIEACPTQAISSKGYIMDGSKCISYYTIELKGALPEEIKSKLDGWMFGCDVCQQVCPWNRFSTPHHENDFFPSEVLLDMKYADWLSLEEDTFQEIFQGSAVKRTGYSGLIRNIEALVNAGD